MKKRTAWAATGLAAGALAAAMTVSAFAAQGNGEKITAESAKETALNHAGVEEGALAYVNTKLDRDDGRQVYDVKFVTEGHAEYDYEISADDGKILNADYELEDHRAGAGNGKSISLETARETALSHADKKAGEVSVAKEKTDYDHGRQVHEVEFYAGADKYEYEVDAATGNILKWDYEAGWTDGNGAGQKSEGGSQSSSKAVTMDEAKAAALKTAGLKDSQVTWGGVHADYDDGRRIYEGNFYSSSLEYEFEVDAQNGNVIGWDVENIYD